jgi:predicted metal-dependent hydrolase
MNSRGRGVWRQVETPEGPFRYRLRRGATRYLTVSVAPDLSVDAIAPREASARDVDQRVLRRLGWIRHHQRDFLQYHPLPTPKRFISGEGHSYLGRQYRLRVERGPERVTLVAGRLVVRVPSRRRRSVERALARWYRSRARAVFAHYLQAVLQAAPWLGPTPGSVRVRAMTRRWGSCSARGTITLNVHLVKTPPSCIEYVIAHELAHRLEMSHSRRFYRLLDRAVPDWRRVQDRLNRSVA